MCGVERLIRIHVIHQSRVDIIDIFREYFFTLFIRSDKVISFFSLFFERCDQKSAILSFDYRLSSAHTEYTSVRNIYYIDLYEKKSYIRTFK